MSAYLQFEQLSKCFPGVKALDDVSFSVASGTVHGLLGENGAGKSTLLKTLGGQYRPDSGQLIVGGKVQHFRSPADAIAAGIAIIHQELHYVPSLTVTENILLGRLPRKWGLLDRKQANQMVSQRLQDLGVDLNPNALLSELSIAQRQMVEICKALMQDAQVLAFDEPTSSLSHHESEILFKIIRNLRAEGRAIIYISHRLEELYALCDACTIFRDGRKVASYDNLQKISTEQLMQDMVGRELNDIYDYQARALGQVRLTVNNLAGRHLPHAQSFSVKSGEIVGFFGLVGAGRSELMRLLYGADKRKKEGSIRIDEVEVKANNVDAAIRAGIVLCPEDRKEQGILGQASVAENINISSRRTGLRAGVFLPHKKEAQMADHFIQKLKIKTPNRHQIISNLSGGNQQKVILARWLAQPDLNVLILDEPTRGIDVGAKNEIYKIIYEVASRGCCVIVVSSELQEVLGVSDRVIVMRDGQISGQLSREEASETAVLKLALADFA